MRHEPAKHLEQVARLGGLLGLGPRELEARLREAAKQLDADPVPKQLKSYRAERRGAQGSPQATRFVGVGAPRPKLEARR